MVHISHRNIPADLLSVTVLTLKRKKWRKKRTYYIHFNVISYLFENKKNLLSSRKAPKPAVCTFAKFLALCCTVDDWRERSRYTRKCCKTNKKGKQQNEWFLNVASNIVIENAANWKQWKWEKKPNGKKNVCFTVDFYFFSLPSYARKNNCTRFGCFLYFFVYGILRFSFLQPLIYS